MSTQRKRSSKHSELFIDSITPLDDINRLHARIASEMESFNQRHLADVQLSLSDYLEAVKLVVHDSFDHDVWVRAEIQAMNTKSGHYYFELAEKDEDGGIIASCRATLWRYRANALLQSFLKGTGRTLSAGASVLLKVNATFHAQYGFSLNISDIDPTYTLGALVQAYHAMLKRLQDTGLTQLNKSLPAPFDIRHVIVIAPEQAAGLGDFRAEADRLAQAGACTFHYHYATFQGNHAPDEIRMAIGDAMRTFGHKYDSLPDLLVIIRGGGAVGDLAYLNDYELAAFVAEQPVPVWVGIGHQRDTVILDEVAHSRFDTPSKVITAIEQQLIYIIDNAKATMTRISHISNTMLTHAKNNTQYEVVRLQHSATKRISLANERLGFYHHRLAHSIQYATKTSTNDISTLLTRTQAASLHIITNVQRDIDNKLGYHRAVTSKLHRLSDECRHLQGMIFSYHPRRTLSLGYAIVRQGGQVVCSSDQLRTGVLDIEFSDSIVTMTVDNLS